MNIVKVLTLLLVILLPFTHVYSEGIPENEIMVDNETSEQESTPIVTEDAEKRTVSSINNYFELELIRGTQNPLNKSIPFTLHVTPKIDSSKTQVIWEVPSTLEVNTLHKEFTNLVKDQTYTFKANITPKRGGTYDITANIVSWQHDTNYTNSVSSTLTLSNAFVVQPVDSEYTISIILMVVGSIILTGIGGYLIYKVSGRLIKKLKIWLTLPY